MAALIDLLDAKARDHFNREGVGLLKSVVRLPTLPNQTSGFQPDVFSTTKVTEANVEGDMHVSHRTSSGEVVSLLSSDPGGWIGLAGDGFRAFKKIATALQRLPLVEAVATVGNVEQSAFAWVKAAIRGSTTLGLADFVANTIESRVLKYRVVIPVGPCALSRW